MVGDGRITPSLSSLNTMRLYDAILSASHAARCVACQGVRSDPVPVALVDEYSIPVV
jgi:hypothetical protein